MAPCAEAETSKGEEPGVVRLVRENSSFKRAGDADILPGDWAWFAELGNDFVRFEVVLEPTPPIPPDEKSQD